VGIFIVGGSSVAGDVKSPEFTLSALLEKELNSYVRQHNMSHVGRVEVINAGVSGYFSTQELLYMMYYLIAYKPDMFIVLDGHNDFFFGFDRWFPDGWMPNANSYTVTQYVWLNRHMNLRESFGLFLMNLIEKSYFLKLTYVKLNQRYKANPIKTPDTRHPITGKYYPVVSEKTDYDMKATVENYERNLKAMIGFCSMNDVKLALFLQPSLVYSKKRLSGKEREILDSATAIYGDRFTVSQQGGKKKTFFELKEEFFAESGKMYERLNGRYASDGVIIRNLFRLLDDCPSESYVDVAHYNENGNKLISEGMFDSVASRLIEYDARRGGGTTS
jgi:lysophospholipase L1-like esterase